MSETPQHWPTERMIQEGHADYATPEDLEGLDEALLVDISQICEVPTAAPDECVPCLAYAVVMDRRNEAALKALEEMAPPTPDPNLGDAGEMEPPIEETHPRLVETMRQESPFREEKPVVERFVEQVRALDSLVSELLEGPPIPPPNVSEEELALLVVAAQRWIKITEAQGVELSAPQQAILDATKTLVARLHRG